MNFDDLTGLVLKIFKSPVPVLFVGLAVYFVAPQEHRWMSWVIIALGIGALLDSPVKHIFSYLCDMREIKENLKGLNKKEKGVLLECLTKQEKTVHLIISEYGYSGRKGSFQDFDALRACWGGLRQKRIVIVAEQGRGSYAITIKPIAWDNLVKMHPKDPSYFDTST